MAQSVQSNKMPRYTSDLPYGRLLKLYRILDASGQWRELGGQLNFSQTDIDMCGMALQRRDGSPTEELLRKWGHLNPTVVELFHHLEHLNDQALETLRGQVPESMFQKHDDTKAASHENLTKNFPAQKGYTDSATALAVITSELAGPSILFRSASTETSLPPYQSQVCQQSICSAKSYPTNSGFTGHTSVSELTFERPFNKKSDLPLKTLHFSQKQRHRPQPAEHSSYITSSNLAQNHSLGSPLKNTPLQIGIQSTSKASHFSDDLEAALAYTPNYELKEIKEATNNFDRRNILGSGGFGTVYKGYSNKLKMNVAVKQLKNEEPEEIEALFKYRHVHIIPLLGYCKEAGQMCLIYQFMENGALDDKLSCKNGTQPLTWEQRINILLGAAKAVHYLHSASDKPMIHGDIKSANILIDKHFEAKVGDFGLAKQANSGTKTKLTHVSQHNKKVYGSKAYLPREYLQDTSQLHMKTDAYSFGIVIFECCFGRKAGDAKSLSGGKWLYLKEFVEEYREENKRSKLVQHRDLPTATFPENLWICLLNLGYKCTRDRKKARPEFAEIVGSVEYLQKSFDVTNSPESLKCHSMLFHSAGQGGSLHNSCPVHIKDQIAQLSAYQHPVSLRHPQGKAYPEVYADDMCLSSANSEYESDDEYLHPQYPSPEDYHKIIKEAGTRFFTKESDAELLPTNELGGSPSCNITNTTCGMASNKTCNMVSLTHQVATIQQGVARNNEVSDPVTEDLNEDFGCLGIDKSSASDSPVDYQLSEMKASTEVLRAEAMQNAEAFVVQRYYDEQSKSQDCLEDCVMHNTVVFSQQSSVGRNNVNNDSVIGSMKGVKAIPNDYVRHSNTQPNIGKCFPPEEPAPEPVYVNEPRTGCIGDILTEPELIHLNKMRGKKPFPMADFMGRGLESTELSVDSLSSDMTFSENIQHTV